MAIKKQSVLSTEKYNKAIVEMFFNADYSKLKIKKDKENTYHVSDAGQEIFVVTKTNNTYGLRVFNYDTGDKPSVTEIIDNKVQHLFDKVEARANLTNNMAREMPINMAREMPIKK